MSECSLQIFDYIPNKKVGDFGLEVLPEIQLRKTRMNLQIKTEGKINDSFSISIVILSV